MSARPRFLAIDQGTTSTRAILVEDSGARLLGSFVHRQHHPAPGHVEHDPEELLAHVAACLDLGRAAGAQAAGLANQGESCLAWDATTGRALGPVIVWQDDRTAATCARLAADGAEALTLARAGLPLDAYFSASKLAWCLAHLPGARALAAAGRLRLGTTDAFFRHRLTGRCATDPTTASRTSLMDLDRLDWDADLCALFGVPRACLPPIAPTTGDLGTARGLALTASVVDQQAALYGHGARAPGQAKVTFGTGAFALCPTAARAAAGQGPLPTVAWALAGAAPGYALEGGVYAAGAAVNWARGLGLFSDWDQIAAFDGPPAIARGVVFVPALAGLACPHWRRDARGGFLGLDLGCGPRDMARAVLEGIAFRTAEVIESIAALQPLDGAVRIDGGLSGNPAFVRFLADTLARPVIVSHEAELTAVGCAALAAHGAGAALALAPGGQMVAPAPQPAHWRARFADARASIAAYGAPAD
ncbi:FGGY family carbohydrate kinase [Rhodobaculum claviforme]|uniref:ATP:glycerol 3-phosphotransferase n=1 Tax=Rhodobaculum claviforme TaxID=1549854 RepID=A0A934WJB4_9RHOB|nr:FGGY family carbohydrate kinase [Rhodobaculum claviforme]MBK5927343.1 glycerol kinase [Rhodobaculum claviforme]